MAMKIGMRAVQRITERQDLVDLGYGKHPRIDHGMQADETNQSFSAIIHLAAAVTNSR